jgi:DNA polymerase-3 subunit epsilon
MTILCIDFETADYYSNSACALAMVKIQNNRIVAEKSILIRPPRRRIIFSYIHKLTWNNLKNQPTFSYHWPGIKDWFDDVDYIAAHNAGFDRGVLFAVLNEIGADKPKAPFLCTVRMSRLVWKLHPTKLNLVCSYLGIPLNHHEALSDARACAQIILAAKRDAEEFDEILIRSLLK